MAKDKTTLRFWLRADRLNADGTCPIHLIYQIQGQRKYYAIPGIKLLSANWDPKEQQAIFVDKKKIKKINPSIDVNLLLTHSEVEDINSKLSEVTTDIRNAESRFKLDQVAFSVSMVIDALKEMKQPKTKKNDPETNIADFISRFISETNQHKQGTLKEYKSLANHIRNFEIEKNIVFSFETIDVSQIKGFQNFLLEKKEVKTKTGKKRIVQINNITIAKLLSTLKTLLRRAEGEYDINVNPKYKNFKNPHPRKDSGFEVIALTEEEFISIWNLDLSNIARLDEARDIYCFSIATGFRYGDLEQFDRPHVKKDNVIRMASSDKNGKIIEVPLNPISFAILQKYADRHKPLPVTSKGKILSNQKLNDYIKEIGEMAGIDTPIEVVRDFGTKKKSETFKKYELLSIHTGRKTFITLSLEKGIPLQDVMSLSTHSSFSAVKRYINITKERKKTVMANAWGTVPKSNLKVV